MQRNTYLGILGIISFFFGIINLLFIINYPMIGYLVFKAAKGSYSIAQYKKSIPFESYAVTIVLFIVTTGIFLIISKDKANENNA